MPPIRFRILVDPRSIAFCRVIDLRTGEDVHGVADIAWRYAPDGSGTVVLTFDATMVDFAIALPSVAEKASA